LDSRTGSKGGGGPDPRRPDSIPHAHQASGPDAPRRRVEHAAERLIGQSTQLRLGEIVKKSVQSRSSAPAAAPSGLASWGGQAARMGTARGASSRAADYANRNRCVGGILFSKPDLLTRACATEGRQDSPRKLDRRRLEGSAGQHEASAVLSRAGAVTFQPCGTATANGLCGQGAPQGGPNCQEEKHREHRRAKRVASPAHEGEGQKQHFAGGRAPTWWGDNITKRARSATVLLRFANSGPRLLVASPSERLRGRRETRAPCGRRRGGLATMLEVNH